MRITGSGFAVKGEHPPSRRNVGTLAMFGNGIAMLVVLWITMTAGMEVSFAHVLFALLSLAFLSFPGQSPRRPGRDVLDGAGTILVRVCLAYGIASVCAVLIDPRQPSSLVFAAAISVPALLISREGAHLAEVALSGKGPLHRVLIVGGGEVARRLVSNMASHPEYRLQVVGAIDDDPMFDSNQLGTSVLGGFHDIAEVAITHNADLAIVAFTERSPDALVGPLRKAMSSGIEVWVVPRFFEVGYETRGTADAIWDVPVTPLLRPPSSRPAWGLKRVVDLVIAGTATVALAPLLGLIAFLVRLDLGRPVLHRQLRVGMNDRPFTLFKFRSMKTEDENVENTEWTAPLARITRLGRILRVTSLDELPQLFNVLRGDMSLVGPRPERLHFVKLFEGEFPHYSARHRVPGGITGWAQIHGLCGDTSIEDRVKFDNYYIERWSLASDFKIMLRTVKALMTKFTLEATRLRAQNKALKVQDLREETVATTLAARVTAREAAEAHPAHANGLRSQAAVLYEDAQSLSSHAAQLQAEVNELRVSASELETRLDDQAEQVRAETNPDGSGP